VAVLAGIDNKYLVDNEGYVLALVQDTDKGFSEVTYDEKVEVGTFIHQNIVPTSIKLIDLAKEANLTIKKMKFNSQYITLNINDNIEVDLSLAKDNTLAMKQIAAIIEKTSLDGQKLRKVDLRFEKVIVLYD
jgi:cell division septal protein FtsQ